MRSREDNAIFTRVPIEDIEFYEQTINELQQENDYLKKEYNNLLKENSKTITNMSNIIDINKKIRNKAIEYLNELGTQDGMIKDYKIDRFIKEDLLEILKGDSNE